MCLEPRALHPKNVLLFAIGPRKYRPTKAIICPYRPLVIQIAHKEGYIIRLVSGTFSIIIIGVRRSK